jgi:hypothetical protein
VGSARKLLDALAASDPTRRDEQPAEPTDPASDQNDRPTPSVA